MNLVLADRLAVDSVVEADCPQCGDTAREPVLHSPVPTAGGPWRVVRCRDCALMYTSPRPPSDQLQLYYPDDYGPHQARGRSRPGARMRRAVQRAIYRACCRAGRIGPVADRLLDSHLPRKVPASTLLDIGCGAGEYLARVQSLGWKTVGVEPTATAVERARRLGLSVLRGTFAKERFPNQHFDVVTLWEVLEHVEDPCRLIAEVGELLAPRGQLMLSVPNQAGWSARYFGPDWLGWDLPRHLTHFTPASLARLLQSQNLRIVSLKTIGHDGWIRASARLSTSRLRRHRLLRTHAVSRTQAGLNVRRGLGESIFVLAERRPGVNT